VPAIVISPYSKTSVCHTTFDHSSIMSSISTRWNVKFDERFGTRWKDAPDFWGCFDFNQTPLPVGNYAESEILKDETWEHGIQTVVTQPPGGVLANLERLFILPTHAVLDGRSKLFDVLADTEREVVRLKRIV
jgi:phospholipase C